MRVFFACHLPKVPTSLLTTGKLWVPHKACLTFKSSSSLSAEMAIYGREPTTDWHVGKRRNSVFRRFPPKTAAPCKNPYTHWPKTPKAESGLAASPACRCWNRVAAVSLRSVMIQHWRPALTETRYPVYCTTAKGSYGSAPTWVWIDCKVGTGKPPVSSILANWCDNRQNTASAPICKRMHWVESGMENRCWI